MKKLGFDEFKTRAIKVHGGKYTYDSSSYVSLRKKLRIICPEHGEFFQEAQSHLHGHGCPKCGMTSTVEKQLFNKDYVVEKLKEVHKNYYSYEFFNYNGMNKKSCVVCPKHGKFYITPSKHLIGQGCPKCGGTARLNGQEFIKNAKAVHGDKYDYSKVDYVNSNTKVCIICPKHGEFFQTPHNHVHGKQGCPRCRYSHLEKEIKKCLDEKNITYHEQKRFEWLGRQSLDFYLPQYNAAIECQGKQHFGLGGWTDKSQLEKIALRDNIKRQLCNDNGIRLFYFSNKKFTEEIYTDFEEIINILENNGNREKGED